MKKIFLTVYFMMLAVVLSVIPAQSFNPATHVYIADQAFTTSYKIDLYYGSTAPDLDQYTDETKWAIDPFSVTHYASYSFLLANAHGGNQKAFAQGWCSHNQDFGADFYAHGTPPNYENGYVTARAIAMVLSGKFPGLTKDFAHFAIEAAIDLLLKWHKDSSLGVKLLKANLFRSPLDRELLTKVLVWQNGWTDWFTLFAAELTFRNALNQYATALALPYPYDEKALIRLGVQLAQQEFGIPVTPTQLGDILNTAILLCETDYYESAIGPAIAGLYHRCQ